eukprot:scpid71178/ scgid11900/ Radial spoke head protein 3 homolog; Radial spoke head-like protein 2
MPIPYATKIASSGPPGLGPEGTYSFSAAPRAQVAQPRRKPMQQQQQQYRDAQALVSSGEVTGQYGNLMFERRIVRGNTYAQAKLISTQPDPVEIQRQQEIRRRALARRKKTEQQRPRTPDAVEGRKHETVQTDAYLYELGKAIEERDVEVQTDDRIDRPPTPVYVPAKTGIDQETQIYPGDLFDFEIECKPLVSVLVAKSMEQALIEVMEEEELVSLKERQREFEELRQAELLEAQRLEEKERRHQQEKEDRRQQMLKANELQKETAAKVAMLAFATGYVGDLIPSVFGQLDNEGFFADPALTEVEVVFMPELMDHVQSIMEERFAVEDVLDEMIASMVDDIYGNDYPELLEEMEQPAITIAVEDQDTFMAETRPADSNAGEEEASRHESPAHEEVPEDGARIFGDQEVAQLNPEEEVRIDGDAAEEAEADGAGNEDNDNIAEDDEEDDDAPADDAGVFQA